MNRLFFGLLSLALFVTACVREDIITDPENPEVPEVVSEEDDSDDPLSFASTGDPTSDDDISKTTFAGRIKITFSEAEDASVSGDSYGYVTVDGNKVTVITRAARYSSMN